MSFASLAAVLSCCRCAAPGASAAGAVSPSAWDSAQQRQVLAAGLMQDSEGSFAGAATLTATQADAAMAALAGKLGAQSAEAAQVGEGSPAGEAPLGEAPPAGQQPAAQAPAVPPALVPSAAVGSAAPSRGDAA